LRQATRERDDLSAVERLSDRYVTKGAVAGM